MTIHKQINADLVSAMKLKDTKALSFLRVIKGEFGRVGKDLSDSDALKVLKKMHKNAKELGNEFEAEFLETYMPKMLSTEELTTIVKRHVEECGLSGMQDMGQVMNYLKKTYTGLYDGKVASSIVRSAL